MLYCLNLDLFLSIVKFQKKLDAEILVATLALPGQLLQYFMFWLFLFI